MPVFALSNTVLLGSVTIRHVMHNTGTLKMTVEFVILAPQSDWIALIFDPRRSST
jgi:hypothetical protein